MELGTLEDFYNATLKALEEAKNDVSTLSLKSKCLARKAVMRADYDVWVGLVWVDRDCLSSVI